MAAWCAGGQVDGKRIYQLLAHQQHKSMQPLLHYLTVASITHDTYPETRNLASSHSANG
jgi:hypothetical protein